MVRYRKSGNEHVLSNRWFGHFVLVGDTSLKLAVRNFAKLTYHNYRSTRNT